MISTFVAIAVIAVIGVIFAIFLNNEIGLSKMSKALEEINKQENLLEEFEKKIPEVSVSKYKETICIKTPKEMKTNIPSSEIFSEFALCKAKKINLKLLDAASGTLVGLGLFGTFLGLTLGIANFESSSTEKIQESIQSLLGGMSTAFYTSLAGMGFSLIYTIIDKSIRNKFSRNLYDFTEKLDNKYYIDDLSLLQSKLVYTDSDNKEIPIANAIREILKENESQSKALGSFSSDLAIEINDRFDESLSRQMQAKIVPLMENVNDTTKIIIEHIDKMSEQVSSPATDMIENVVTELKNSMTSIIKEFNSGLSGSATSELENLAKQLGTAAQSMADFPRNMENISATLQVTIEEVKKTISDISNSSASANSTVLEQMQNQISLATSAISNAIIEVKEVMNGITHTSQEQNNQMTTKLVHVSEQIGEFLNATMSSLSVSVQESIKNITDDVNTKQANLINLQEDTTTQTRKLLESFNNGLERLEKMNEYISGTMNMFQQAQNNITGSTANLQTISGDMKLATQLFSKGQNDYADKLERVQQNTQTNIDTIANLLVDTSEMSEEYAKKFEIIRTGLGGIFEQLQKGLFEYSKTVGESTQMYLDKYTSHLTKTTDALSSNIQQLHELIESLTEHLTSNRK